MKGLVRVLFIILLAVAPLRAQLGRPEMLHVVAPIVAVTAAPGSTLEVPVQLDIAAGFHINAEKPTYDYMIPTRLEWASPPFKVAGIQYPPAEKREFEFQPGDKLDVYEGVVKIVSRFQIPKTVKPVKLTLQGKLRYQACDNKVCYPPVTVPFQVPVEIVKAAAKKK
jgi:thiol:disulfide interchange protein DsbD